MIQTQLEGQVVPMQHIFSKNIFFTRYQQVIILIRCDILDGALVDQLVEFSKEIGGLELVKRVADYPVEEIVAHKVGVAYWQILEVLQIEAT